MHPRAAHAISTRTRNLPRVAIVAASYSVTGVPTIQMRLATTLAARGFSVDFVTFGPWGGIEPAVVRLVELRGRRALAAFPYLCAYLVRNKPAAMICAEDHANVFALVARRLSRVDTRVCVTSRAPFDAVVDPPVWSREHALLLLMKYTYPWADCVGAVSGGLGDELAALIDLPRTKVRTLYNPVITTEVLEQTEASVSHPWLDAGIPVILACGSLAPIKGFHTLIEAFGRFVERRHCRLLILGDGCQRSDLEAQIGALGLQEVVDLPGSVTNPLGYMARCDLFVLSSEFEAFGNVLVEALAAGARIVSTDCQYGPREILDGGRYGRLVPVGDVDRLAMALSRGLDSPGDPATQRERSMDFCADLCADKYLQALGINSIE